MIGICIAFLLGSWIGSFGSPQTATISIIIIFIIWLLLRMFSGKSTTANTPSSLVVLLLVFSTAWLSSSFLWSERHKADQTIKEIIESKKDVLLTGVVVSEPTYTIQERGGARVRFDFKVHQIKTETESISISPRNIQVSWYGPTTMTTVNRSFPIPQTGEGWELYGRIRETISKTNQKFFVMNISKRREFCNHYEKLDSSNIAKSLYKMRNYAAEILSLGSKGNSDEAGIIKAMILGYRSEVSSNVMDYFKMSGTVHIFAISGMHVGIVAGIIMFVLSFAGLPYWLRTALFIPLIIAYVIATGARPSAVRACIMAVVLFGLPVVGRSNDIISTICIAAILIATHSPWLILNAGFMLSFVCVIGIVLFVPLMNETSIVLYCKLKSRSAKRNTIEFPEQKKSIPKRLLHYSIRYIQLSLPVSFAAWFASTPVTAMFFARITPISIICNLLVIPLAFLIVTTAALSIAFGSFLPIVSEYLNYANYLVTASMKYTVKAMSSLPFASFETTNWGIPSVLIWYIAAAMLYVFIRIKLEDAAYETLNKKEF